MKKQLLILCLVLLFPVTAVYGADFYKILADEDLVVTSSAAGFASVPDNVKRTIVSIQGDTVRWKMDTDPEANNGAKLADGDYLILNSPYEVNNIKFILSTGGSAATAYAVHQGSAN